MKLKAAGFLLSLILFFSLGYLASEWHFLPSLFAKIFFRVGSPDQTLSLGEGALSSLDYSLLNKIYALLQKTYLSEKPLNSKDLIYGAARGLVNSLGDPYTAFFDPSQNEQFKEDLSGIYEGIGAQLGFKDHQLVVVAPLSGSPAEEAGVRAGDAILAVDGKDTQGMSLPEVVSQIRGEAGSEVVLSLARGEDLTKAFEIKIKRQKISVPSVLVEWVGGSKKIAHLKILRFGDDTKRTWDKVIKEVTDACHLLPATCRIILDLRNNPGGYLDVAVYLAAEFLDAGVVTIKEGAEGKKEEFKVDHPGDLIDAAVIVLMNEGSASASEILAGSLKARNRAKLVGVKSFGKGTVQEAYELGEDAGVHITTARWLLPNGENIDGAGIAPDYEIQNTEESLKMGQDLQLDKAVELLENVN